MSHSKVTKEEKMKSIENKYSKKISRLLNTYKDRSMGEFWAKIDELKEKMRVELDEIQ